MADLYLILAELPGRLAASIEEYKNPKTRYVTPVRGKPGAEALRRALRANQKWRGTEFALLPWEPAANGVWEGIEFDREQAVASGGAFRELVKDAEELAKRLRIPLEPVAPGVAIKRRRRGGKRARPERRESESGLVIDEIDRVARYDGRRLPINPHSDFDALLALHAAKGVLVKHVELLRAMKPAAVSGAVSELKEAPQEVKDAVAHIRSAFRKSRCPYPIEPVRGKGYRMHWPDR